MNNKFFEQNDLTIPYCKYKKINIDKLTINDLTLINLKEIFPLYYLYNIPVFTIDKLDDLFTHKFDFYELLNNPDDTIRFSDFLALKDLNYFKQLKSAATYYDNICKTKEFKQFYKQYEYFIKLYNKIIKLIDKNCKYEFVTLPTMTMHLFKDHPIYMFNCKNANNIPYPRYTNHINLNTDKEDIANYLGLLSKRQYNIINSCLYIENWFKSANNLFKSLIDDYSYLFYNSKILSLELVDKAMFFIIDEFIKIMLNTSYNISLSERSLKIFLKKNWIGLHFTPSIIDEVLSKLIVVYLQRKERSK